MFVLTTLQEDIDVEPCDLNKPRTKAVSDVIERDFIDKVIPDVGLVVSLWDIQSITGGTIVPSEGSASYSVVFRVVSFLPFIGEVLVGTLADSDKNGVSVSLGDFYKDVCVPESNLPEPSVYISEDTSGGVWRWDFEGNELFLDKGEQVRVRVKEVRFSKIPTPTEMREDGIGTAAKPFKQMEVFADMNEDGLGAITWWSNAEPEEEEEEPVE